MTEYDTNRLRKQLADSVAGINPVAPPVSDLERPSSATGARKAVPIGIGVVVVACVAMAWAVTSATGHGNNRGAAAASVASDSAIIADSVWAADHVRHTLDRRSAIRLRWTRFFFRGVEFGFGIIERRGRGFGL